MPITKLVALIVRVFLYSALVNIGAFFISFFVNTVLLNLTLPVGTHALASLDGAVTYAIYTGLQMSIFFTTFSLLIIRLSIFSCTILTLRDIVQYYKKFIFTSVIFSAALVCALCMYFANFSLQKEDLAKSSMTGDIVTYAMPCLWLILTVAFYRNYQLKLNEPDGSKDRSWLEGNIEN